MRRKQLILCAALIVAASFLMGGGLGFVYTLIYGPTYYEDIIARNPDPLGSPKMIAFSPAAMLLYILGFLGVFMLYLGGKEYKQNPDLANKRLFAAVNLIGVAYVGLELLLRFGAGAF